MKILVYGASEFGQVVRNLVKNCEHEFAGFVDDYQKGKNIICAYEQIKEHYQVTPHANQTMRAIEKQHERQVGRCPICSFYFDYGIVIAVGYKDLKTRWAIYQKVKTDGFKVVSLVHPQAIVDKTAKIGEGVIIMAGAIVDYNAEIKDLAVLWNGAVVSHDSVIGENTFLSPNSTVCGCVSVGRDCFVGAGAVVTDHIKMPDGSFIGAGKVELKKIRIASPRFLKQ